MKVRWHRATDTTDIAITCRIGFMQTQKKVPCIRNQKEYNIYQTGRSTCITRAHHATAETPVQLHYLATIPGSVMNWFADSESRPTQHSIQPCTSRTSLFGSQFCMGKLHLENRMLFSITITPALTTTPIYLPGIVFTADALHNPNEIRL
jgi:hypothetical protein